jgi:hypothetical protein
MTVQSLRFVPIALASLAIAFLVAAPSAAGDEPDRYVDRGLGFSFSKPHFPVSDEKNLSIVPITLAGPPQGGFAPNVNVVVQNIETTLEDFKRTQAGELSSLGWEVVEHSIAPIAGKPSLRTRARGSVQGFEIEFLAVAIMREGKKAFVLTCTATKTQYPAYEAEFERVVSSFSLAN